MDTQLPFFDTEHQELALNLQQWCAAHLQEHDDSDVDNTCLRLVLLLGENGWLQYCVPSAYGGALEAVDSRALCILRETLAYHDGLADFSFAMQGLGSGAITLFGTE